MKLYEYQAKQIFATHGIHIPQGSIASDAEQVAKIAENLGSVVLKPQLSVKGRGKVGGILFADTPQQAREQAQKLFSMTIKQETVENILVEKKADIRQELYLSIAIDYAARRPVVMATTHGGVDIENIAASNPEELLKTSFALGSDLDSVFLEKVHNLLGDGSVEVLQTLTRIFCKYDAEMVEINPLVRTKDGALIAVDAVLNVNEDSLFRQSEIVEFKKQSHNLDTIEEKAKAESWTYIELDGNIGILSSGAGITMAILDLLHKNGGKPANFLDTAQMDGDGIYRAFDLLLANKAVKVVLVNIFAGLNRCDDLATGLKRYINERKPEQPVVVRMIGNREDDGTKILKEIGLQPVTVLEDAIDKTIRIARETQ